MGKHRKVLQMRKFLKMERTGIEPVTSGLQSRESERTAENGRERVASESPWLTRKCVVSAHLRTSPVPFKVASKWRQKIASSENSGAIVVAADGSILAHRR
jgi:hypothetical protein